MVHNPTDGLHTLGSIFSNEGALTADTGGIRFTMSLKFNTDDYVRVPLPSRLEANDSSDPELDGDIEPTVETTTPLTERVPNAWNIEFYQQHFDVDTHQVLRRLAFSVIPNPRSNFIQHVLKPRADLYGPFWIATTLILASAIGGNISSYLQSRGRLTSWRYDFRKGLGSLAVSQPSCFPRVTWQLGTERVLQLNSFFSSEHHSLLALQVGVETACTPVLRRCQLNCDKKSFSCSTLSVPNCHATINKHDGLDTVRLAKSRLGKPRGRGRVRTTSLYFRLLRTRWPKWLEREFTDRELCGSNPTSASRIPLSRLGQPGNIPILVLFRVVLELGTERMLQPNIETACTPVLRRCQLNCDKKSFSCSTLSVPNCHATINKHDGLDTVRLAKSRLGKPRGRGRVRTTSLYFRLLRTRWPKWLEREFTDRELCGSNPTSASRIPLSRLGQPGNIPILVLFRVALELGTERMLQPNITLASTVIYMYWWLVPLGIVAFFYMQSRKSSPSSGEEDQDPLVAQPQSRVRGRHTGVKAHNFVELLSVYGYSLTIFVPVSILWAIPNTVLQWSLVVLAMVISGAFLAFALFPFFRREHSKIAGPLIIGIVLLHCAFSVGLMMTFFPGSPSVVTTPVVAPVVPAGAAVPAGPVALDSAKADVPRAVPDLALKDKEKIIDTQKTAR
ncbi:Yip1 member 1 [Clonorchis sinensis]|uniref:Yip1 member 1 n=1 Tax=Clonorchis sinensis TaxID=79923 RepID=A0A8T1M7D9_CLOSI|nr:Yip1 member 1 [Clonorchis sinensis]